VSIHTLSQDDFFLFRNYFYRETGIYFDENKRYFVDRRIIERMIAVNSPSFQNYFSRLRWGADLNEMEILIHIMTVHETYFFREQYQLECMVKDLLTERSHKTPHQEILRIWSAGCSTGEEPYSLAIYLLERWPLLKHRDVQILASDIDQKVLEKAKAGIYHSRSVNSLPTHYLDQYFVRLNNESYQINLDLRQSVGFFQTNLFNQRGYQFETPLDLIFCRNVLIYFDETARQAVIDRFYQNLKPGGFLCLGHSESLHNITHRFMMRKFPDAVVYQKSLTDY
jgi:chemotaxis protein methyltransferase CheR